MSQRKSGKVVSIRISPLDCLSIIDICKKAGIIEADATFPGLTSQALKMMIHAYKTMGMIPVRDGFEWNEMMEPFDEDIKARSNKAERKAHVLIPESLMQSIPAERQRLPPDGIQVVPEANKELKEELIRLADRRETLGFDHPNWTAAEQRRYDELYAMNLWGNN
jgi:hypothetical protein